MVTKACKWTPDVFNQDCPSRRVVARVADKWTALCIYALSRGPHRYSELKRRIHGVSQKMLTQTLRDLETDGLVARKVYPVIPPHTEYSLTPLGNSLLEPLAALCAWSEKNWSKVEQAREKNQARATARAPA